MSHVNIFLTSITFHLFILYINNLPCGESPDLDINKCIKDHNLNDVNLKCCWAEISFNTKDNQKGYLCLIIANNEQAIKKEKTDFMDDPKVRYIDIQCSTSYYHSSLVFLVILIIFN